MEAEFRRQRARGQVVRARERREEVIERVLVGEVHGGHVEAPLVLVAVEQVVLAQRRIEDIPRRDTLRIVVVVASAGRGNGDEAGGELRRQAGGGQRGVWGGLDAGASEARLKLLVSREGHAERVDHEDGGLAAKHRRGEDAWTVGIARGRPVTRSGTRNQSAVIAPVEPEPRRELASWDLVLQVGGLVELLVVVDAERISALADGRARTGHLRRVEACSD